MKTLIASIAAFFFAFSAQIAVAADAEVKTTTTITVIRQDPQTQVPTDCPGFGTGCTITVTIERKTGVISPVSPGYNLSVTGMPMTVTVVRDGISVVSPASNRAITFPSGSAVEIMSCATYPFLVGEIVSIAGVSTNSNGDFGVNFIP